MVHGPLPSVCGHVTGELGGAPGRLERHRHGVGPGAAVPRLMEVRSLGCRPHDGGPVELARDDQRATVVADGQADGGFGSEQASRDLSAVVTNVAEGGVPGDTALEGHGVEPFGLS